MSAVLRDVDEITEVLVSYPSARTIEHHGYVGVQVWHQGFWITALCATASWEAPLVYLAPEPASHHYYRHGQEPVARLCYEHAEWEPSWRLLTAVTITMRWVNEYVAGGAR